MLIISGFAGIGKTTLSKKIGNILDLESSKFKWILPDDMKQLNNEEGKGLTIRNLNPDWPENYITTIYSQLENPDIEAIFISPSDEILDRLTVDGVKFIIVYPSLDSKSDMLERYKDRNNSVEFVHKLDALYEAIIESIVNRPEKSYVLGKGQYLSDIYPQLLTLEDTMINAGIHYKVTWHFKETEEVASATLNYYEKFQNNLGKAKIISLLKNACLSETQRIYPPKKYNALVEIRVIVYDGDQINDENENYEIGDQTEINKSIEKWGY